MERSRFRRWAKWVGLLTCVFLLGVIAVSARWHFGCIVQLNRSLLELGVTRGGMVLVAHKNSKDWNLDDWYFRRSHASVWMWKPFSAGQLPGPLAMIIPLWIPLAVAALPTAWLNEPKKNCQIAARLELS